jgi:hypothetical protein
MSMSATYVSVFDDTIICESPCRYDPVIRRVYDIEPADCAAAENADSLIDEYVFVAGTVRRAADGVSFDY